MMGFRFVDHTADVAMELTASSPAELLVEAVRGFCALTCGQAGGPPATDTVDVMVPGEDGEQRLVHLLNDLIYRLETRQELWCDAEVVSQEAGGGVTLRLKGTTCLPQGWMIETSVKAATYHGLEVVDRGSQVRAVVVLDT